MIGGQLIIEAGGKQKAEALVEASAFERGLLGCPKSVNLWLCHRRGDRAGPVQEGARVTRKSAAEEPEGGLCGTRA